MDREPPITTTGEIVEVINERGYKARLPNGKEIHAHYSKRTSEPPSHAVGDLVTLLFSPYDLSRARITAAASALEDENPGPSKADDG